MATLQGSDKVQSLLTSTTLAPELTIPQALKLTAIFTIMATLMPFMLHLWHDYCMFLALGPGGTPKNFYGYLKVTLLSLFALRTPYTPAATPQRFVKSPGRLRSLSSRKGQRPETRGIAPHRQINQKSPSALYIQLATAIEQMGADQPNMGIGTSCFEKNATGLFSTSPAKRTCGGEICHAHPSDGSMHLTLHPADAAMALEAGWAERHPLARGGWFERFVPGGFVMVYAPRDEAEVEAVLQIVKAAAWFVSGGDGIKDFCDERRDSGYVSAEEEEDA